MDPEEEEVEDLSIPGPSFMKLMALTSAPVQPGTVQDPTTVTRDAEVTVLFSGRVGELRMILVPKPAH